MNSLQLRTAFRRLFAQWYLHGLAARCLQFTLIFEAVSHGVGAAWMGAVMAASSVACAVFTIYAGRLYNRFGPSPLNRCAALCCAGAGFLATQHEAPAALAVAWMLTGMTLMLAATAGYRGIGGLFGAADRVSRFSRMCLLSNVSEIAMPVAIGALFSQAPDLMPFIVLAVSLALSFLSSGVSRSDLRAHGLVESTDLLVNIRRLAGSGPLLAGVVAGSGVNALFCILDILVPTAGGGMGLTTTQTGTLLSACALAQVAASSLLSVRANHRTLLPQLRNALLLGGVALSGAALADGFASFLLVGFRIRSGQAAFDERALPVRAARIGGRHRGHEVHAQQPRPNHDVALHGGGRRRLHALDGLSQHARSGRARRDDRCFDQERTSEKRWRRLRTGRLRQFCRSSSGSLRRLPEMMLRKLKSAEDS